MIIGVASGDYQRASKAADGQEHWGGAGWARIGQYVPEWRAAGHEVIVGTLWAMKGRVVIGTEDADGSNETFTEPDVVIMQRLMHTDLHWVVKMGRENGQVIINDLDDWYWGLDQRNDAWWHSHPKNPNNGGQNTSNYAAVMRASTYITTSTPYLADRLRQMGMSAPIEVIPNYVDVSRFTPHEQNLDNPILGWAGSTSHRSGDLEQLQGVLCQLRGEVRFQHSGYMEYSPMFSKAVGLEDDEVIKVNRVQSSEYPSLLNFDIGLVPLRDIPFNHAKSDIKGLEYAAAGIPFVASPGDAYKRLRADWGDAVLVVKRPGDYVKRIRSLIPYARRIEVASELLELVQSRDISLGVAQTLDYIGSVCDA